jgi:hypothetical protein
VEEPVLSRCRRVKLSRLFCIFDLLNTFKNSLTKITFGNWGLGGPGVAAKLEGGVDIVLDVDGRFLGLDEELAGAVDAEGIVGGGGSRSGLEGVFVDDVFVGFGVTLAVDDVPAEGFEKGVEELAVELGLFLVTGAVGSQVVFEALDEVVKE